MKTRKNSKKSHNKIHGKTLKINQKQNNKLKSKITHIDYHIAIPTYKRYEIVVKNTLRMLHDGNVPLEKISIFLASKDEEKHYQQTIDKLSSKFIPNYAGKKIHFIVGVRGIDKQRKFMVRYFHKIGKENIMFMDDDVSAIDNYDNKTKKFKKVENIPKFICNGFKIAKSKDIYLWGLYPIRNGKFIMQRPEIEEGLLFIVGLFYGQRIRNPDTNPDIVPTMKVKEDVENSILHYMKDGGVLRFNRYTIRTSYGNITGGVAADVNEANIKNVHTEAALELKRKYPKCGFIRKSNTYGLNFQLRKLKSEKKP
jgi:hypothetical protein